MDIVELVVWLLLLLGTIVAWCVVAFFAYMVGWSLAADWPPGQPSDKRECLLYVALLTTLVVLVIPASVSAANVIGMFT